MKSLRILYGITIALFVFISFSSCSNDEEDNNEVPSTNIDKESESIISKYRETRLFMGCWECSDPYRTGVVFASDGTCILTSSLNQGVWQYDKVTKLLSTTCNDWVWTINIQTPLQWSGVTAKPTAYSYTRKFSEGQITSWNDPNDELLIGTWIDQKSDISITFKADNTYILCADGIEYEGIYEVNTRLYNEKTYRYLRSISFDGDLSGSMSVQTMDGYRMTMGKASSSLDAYNDGTYIYSEYIE